ncbi:hypothetical protein GE061_016254 [Apolygus lucorum]|uniref:Odorant receptor n=1 Tax=Apolygus lucorum TaxID=248454 RepID=A0A1Q1NII8_APOLU|nr:olfactory receptor [Apolygus lucorum]KAF6207805.1 hypothetical protein GE061_016254 [Apolygus lucorum]
MTLLSFFKDKFKWNEPLGITETTATLFGAFVNYAPSPGYRKFFRFFGWYIIFMFIIFNINVVLTIYFASDFFEESLEAVRLFVTAIHILAKLLTMRAMEKQYMELIEQIRRAWRTYEYSSGDMLNKTLAAANKGTVIVFVAIGNTIPINVIVAALKNLGNPPEIQFSMQCWVPPSLRTSFLAGSFYQLTPYFFPVMLYCMTISFLNSITLHVEALGLALAKEIRSQKEWRDEAARSLYIKHQEVVRIVGRVNDLMASNWGFEMMCATLQLTLVSYNALRTLKKNDVAFFNQANLMLVNFLVIYFIYGNGNRIIKMGEELHNSLYDTKWYTSTVKERKNVLFMMFRTSMPMEYRFKIAHFDLPSFAKLVNTVFSYITLLRSVDEPEEQGAF